MTKVEVKARFDADVKPYINSQDKVALRTAWNDFVDTLQKDGQITEHQANTWRNPYDK